MRVFITGGTGLVGSRLMRALHERGDQAIVLTRSPGAAKAKFGDLCEVVAGDPMQAGPWMEALKNSDAVVNLVGEGVFNRRWTASFKQSLYASRVQSTENVVKAIQRCADGGPDVLVNASAIGYYGPHGDEELTESSAAGDDFLAKLCVDWENAAKPVIKQGVRLAFLRVGVVLDREGGALAKMLTPFKMFVGGTIGSGKQYVSWIHHDDMVGLILFALDNPQAEGPFNATAPTPHTNKHFSKALGKALHRPSFVWTPGFMLRLALGEVANVVTKGQRVLPKKALDLGYRFKFDQLDAALADLFAPKQEPVPTATN